MKACPHQNTHPHFAANHSLQSLCVFVSFSTFLIVFGGFGAFLYVFSYVFECFFMSLHFFAHLCLFFMSLHVLYANPWHRVVMCHPPSFCWMKTAQHQAATRPSCLVGFHRLHRQRWSSNPAGPQCVAGAVFLRVWGRMLTSFFVLVGKQFS